MPPHVRCLMALSPTTASQESKRPFPLVALLAPLSTSSALLYLRRGPYRYCSTSNHPEPPSSSAVFTHGSFSSHKRPVPKHRPKQWAIVFLFLGHRAPPRGQATPAVRRTDHQDCELATNILVLANHFASHLNLSSGPSLSSTIGRASPPWKRFFRWASSSPMPPKWDPYTLVSLPPAALSEPLPCFASRLKVKAELGRLELGLGWTVVLVKLPWICLNLFKSVQTSEIS
jgi:hypothetical protein